MYKVKRSSGLVSCSLLVHLSHSQVFYSKFKILYPSRKVGANEAPSGPVVVLTPMQLNISLLEQTGSDVQCDDVHVKAGFHLKCLWHDFRTFRDLY